MKHSTSTFKLQRDVYRLNADEVLDAFRAYLKTKHGLSDDVVKTASLVRGIENLFGDGFDVAVFINQGEIESDKGAT